MGYFELTAAVAPADAERAADVLRSETGVGIAIELPFVQPDLELGARMRDDAPALVRAYVRGRVALPAISDALSAAGVHARIEQRTVVDEDWSEAWKDYFHVERFGRIVVVPSWREYSPRPDDVIVTLDPGMAFGTGQHETTRMCLEALDRRVRPGMRVLDVGCGSGILALAAAKLDAVHVLAVDVDLDCVRITRDNARSNALDAIVCARVVSEDHPLTPGHGKLDLITANIIASTIIGLAPSLAGSLAPGGRLIASGIIAERERMTSDALAECGLEVDAVRAMGDWRCIEAVRAGAPAR